MFLFVICAIKLALYLADPGVKVVLGDSGSYLAAAIGTYVPPDRSYTYALFLRFLLHIWHSLSFLVMVQVALSAISAMLLTWVSYRVLRLPALTAGICGVVCALEPLQLLSERYILSEAISTFFFAVVISLAVTYLRTAKLRYLLMIAVMGMFLVSLRVYFLPAILLTSFVLPILSSVGASAWRELKPFVGGKRFGKVEFHRDQDLVTIGVAAKLVDGRLRIDWTNRIALPRAAQDVSRFAAHLVISVVALQLSLFALRGWYGRQIHGPAAYIEQDGLFLLADVSTIVQESDFRNRELGHAVFSHLTVPQHEKLSRHWNRWAPGGMIDVLDKEVRRMYPSSEEWEANRVARRTALRALRHHPFAAARLVAENVREYFSVSNLDQALVANEFVDSYIIPSYQDLFSRYFGWRLTYQGRSGVVRAWHQRSSYWCLYLLVCPFLASIALLVPRMPRRRYLLYCVLCAWPLWSISTFLPEELAPRYFTGLAWLLILVTALVIQGIVDLRRTGARSLRAAGSADVVLSG